jgi:hypothetical protein
MLTMKHYLSVLTRFLNLLKNYSEVSNQIVLQKKKEVIILVLLAD